MDLGLGQKNVLITGGSKGIGRACARLFLQEGARVAIVSRDQAHVDAALLDLDSAIGLAADVSDAGSALATIETLETRLGPIDILVNSAGAARRTPFEDLDPAAFRAAMEAKYFTTVNVVDPLIKRMAARRQGVIVNIIGAGGKVASPTHLAGGAANAALMLLTAGWGHAYAPSGVRVVGINPGLTRTGRVAEGLAAEAKSRGLSLEEAAARSTSELPLGRMAEPEEVAALVLFLASHQAGYLTGVTIGMDGAKLPMVV